MTELVDPVKATSGDPVGRLEVGEVAVDGRSAASRSENKCLTEADG